MFTEIDAKQLSESAIFEGLTTEQIRYILPCITYQVKEYHTDERIYAKGDIVGNLGFVLDGCLEICSESAEGRRVVITRIQKNELFGEAVIFSSKSAVPHDVFAIKNSRVLYLAADFFTNSCNAECAKKSIHDDILRNMLRILSDRALVLNRKITYLTAPDLKTKLAMYLYDLHMATGLMSFNMPLNRDGLAEYLAVARPSLSREFVTLKKMGLIDFWRSNVSILNLTELFALAHQHV